MAKDQGWTPDKKQPTMLWNGHLLVSEMASEKIFNCYNGLKYLGWKATMDEAKKFALASRADSTKAP